ncbi:hypothetical protein [Pedococcus sp. 5OH_020]|uniref:hypothetical protein n=1 Tax=Pedococcus sp. 5OH_020 TaxID=2989814 RepID=UPI0022E99959|nr:hypothetical protein [Pedococcus sp. 5OH_020]
MRKLLSAIAAATATFVVTVAAVAVVPQTAEAATATYRLTYLTLPNGSKVPLRWNGCQTAITWKVNLAGVPSTLRPTVLSETKTVVGQLAAYTGFTFSYKGTTTEVPQVGSMPRQTAELVIAYSSPSKTTYNLYGSTLGQGGLFGGWVSRTVSGRTTYTAAATRGFVVLDSPQMLSQTRGGFGTGLRRTNLLSHELGHAIGLEHVYNTAEQMNPVLTSVAPKGLASGDRAGLTRIGKGAGCINTAYMLKDLS